MEVLESSIVKFQTFVSKVKTLQKICHLMWQLRTGHMAVMKNLRRCNMRCNNYCPRYGKPEETVTHVIFEYPPALQVWSQSTTLSSPDIFSLSICKYELPLMRKNSFIEP